MSRVNALRLSLILTVAFSAASAQSAGNPASPDFHKEGVVIEHSDTKIAFRSDGSSTREQNSRVRIQSDAGVQEYGVLRPPYESAIEQVEVLDVRVIKPDKTVVVTSLDQMQDVPSQLYPGSAEYSDWREKHIPVRGLEPGDTLAYSMRWKVEKPLVAGQFWFSHWFFRNAVVLDEQLEISVPLDREVKVKSKSVQPTTAEENGFKVFRWKTSNLESQSLEKQRDAQAYDIIHGTLPPPDILISSFRTWEEVGRWYAKVQQEKMQPSPEIKAKAEELTKDLPDQDAKIRAIYDYVSLRYRYVGIAFGVGRYEPHYAKETFENHYGDCKDKHTLFAALSSAVGIQAYPALVNTHVQVEQDVPSPGQFDHVITVVPRGNSFLWIDSTPEVAPLGYLLYNLRGKPALVVGPDKPAFQTTPLMSPVPVQYTSNTTAKLDENGTLQAHVQAKFRGDDNELRYRYIFRRLPETQWKEFAQKNFYGSSLGGTIASVSPSSPEKTSEPFTIEYDYVLKEFSSKENRFVVPLSPVRIPAVQDRDFQRKTPLWIGIIGQETYESTIELPPGWGAAEPNPLDLQESFAEFHGSTEVKQNIVVTKRRLVLKASEIAPDQLEKYKVFQKAISDNHNLYIFLHRPPQSTNSPR